MVGSHTINTHQGIVSYTNATKESKIPNSLYVVDVWGLTLDGSPLLLEFVYWHDLDASKIEFLQNTEYHTIKFDIRGFNINMGKEAVRERLSIDLSLQTTVFPLTPVDQANGKYQQEHILTVIAFVSGILMGTAFISTFLQGNKINLKIRSQRRGWRTYRKGK